MTNQVRSGILGFVYTKTSLSIKFTNGDVYRYDLSEALDKTVLKQMILLARSGKGLNGFLNSKPQIKRSGFLDTTLNSSSFRPY